MLEKVREEKEEEEQAAIEALLHSKEANKFREVTNKKRHAKGPNPLSVKRRKVGTDEGDSRQPLKPRNRRKRRAKSQPAVVS